MNKSEALLMRAKLHWRGSKRRILENKNPEGIAALYDALLSTMRWHVLTRHVDRQGAQGARPGLRISGGSCHIAPGRDYRHFI